jgi:hypothetical protein
VIVCRVEGVLLDRDGDVTRRDVVVGEVEGGEQLAKDLMVAAAGSGRWCDLKIIKSGEE